MSSFFIKNSNFHNVFPLKHCKLGLTPSGQLSLKGTFGVKTYVKVLWTKPDEGQTGM